ncbi:MAG: glycosyltransferase family 2 protein [Vicinamibacterales bacterium]
MFQPSLVTIVIPCLNQAHFLTEALRSIRRQTYASISTIVVDDGSTDATARAAITGGAILLRQPHRGLSSARNFGLLAADGEFVLFLDADDELLPDAVAAGVAALERAPDAAMVARRCRLIDASGAPLPTHCPVPESDDFYAELLLRNPVWTPGAALFRRQALVEIGGFPEEVGPAADYAVYLEIARTRRVIVDARDAVLYRQHDANMSRDAERMLRATLAVLRRERPKVPRTHRRYFRDGRRAWRRFYGEEIIQQLRATARMRPFGRREVESMALLARECRALAFSHMVRKLARLAQGLPPAEIEGGRFVRPMPDAPQRAEAR